MVRLITHYEKYDRMGGNFRRVESEGETLKDALLDLLDNINMYDDSDSIKETEEETGKEMSAKDILEMIDSQNGDGCDYVILIKDVDSGEIYLDNED